MKRKYWLTKNNYKPYKGQKFKKSSLTVPDMSYSIRDILNRFTRLPDISLTMSFDGDTDEEVLNNAPERNYLDLTDLDGLNQDIQDLKNQLDEISKQYKNQAKQVSEASEAKQAKNNEQGE